MVYPAKIRKASTSLAFHMIGRHHDRCYSTIIFLVTLASPALTV